MISGKYGFVDYQNLSYNINREGPFSKKSIKQTEVFEVRIMIRNVNQTILNTQPKYFVKKKKKKNPL